ncbi:MAG: DHH family phosphoesterase [Bacilli bacterium]|nr:DHH family phosphoesterase [Bacilli bacterium]
MSTILKERKRLNKKIKKAKTIFLMGHKDLDLDALGSCIGMSIILNKKNKKWFIIVDDQTHEAGVSKVLKELDGCLNIIKSEDLEQYIEPKDEKNLLIVLDTNKKNLVQSEKVLKQVSNKVIIDHHDKGKNSIKDAYEIIDTKVSSTCEMITSIIDFYDIDIDPYYSTILLSGIVLDTNNFTLNTQKETFYAAYYLTSLGASAKKVQYLLKQDLKEYTERQKLLSQIETINGKIAFTKASPNAIYRREDLAKMADTLLFFNNIEASFVIGKTGKDIIGLSARSLGNYDIIKILEKLGGGGDTYNGAAKFEKTTINKVETLLKEEIKKEGE